MCASACSYLWVCSPSPPAPHSSIIYKGRRFIGLSNVSSSALLHIALVMTGSIGLCVTGSYHLFPAPPPHISHDYIQEVSYSVVSVTYIINFGVSSTFRSICAVPNIAVFCISLTSCFPGMLLKYFLNEFEIVPVAPIITGITFVFTFQMCCISVVRSL